MYKTHDKCSLQVVLTNIFPDLKSLQDITKNFMPPEKFYIEEYRYGECRGDCSNRIQFKGISKETLEIRPQYFALAAGARTIISWYRSHTSTLSLHKMYINLQGETSMGKIIRYYIKFQNTFFVLWLLLLKLIYCIL